MAQSPPGKRHSLSLLFFVYAGTPSPDVNEAHYLAKAKHYWDPAWCGTDLFLASADAHAAFYAVFGWPSLWVSLPVVTWLGRLLVWGLIAWGWQRLSWSILPRRYVSLLSAAWFLVLVDYCHLAGEWAIGGLEAKGIAYACVLFGLHALMCQRWTAVWIWLGAASAFHVLVGGWSAVAAGLAWWLSGRQRPPVRSMWKGLVSGFALALFGLVPALGLTIGTEPTIATQGQLDLCVWSVTAPRAVLPIRTRALDNVRPAPVGVGRTLVDCAEVAVLGQLCTVLRSERSRSPPSAWPSIF